jgi:hypothetical protein
LHIFFTAPRSGNQAPFDSLDILSRATVAFYWDNPVRHDRPLITNCTVDGLALACGLRPSSATEERDLDMLLANIALADQEGRPLSFSRNKNHAYRGITSGRVLSGVAKIVRELALERRTKPGQRGWQSDLRGTPALTEIFDRLGQEPVYGPRDSIILRSRMDGSLLPMRPSRDLLRQVERLNEMLRATAIGLVMTGALKLKNGLWLFERLEEDQFGNPRLLQQKLRLDQMGGRRVFTSDHKKHGRFYCAAQNIPGSARLQMTLDGHQVVELDFVSMHVALAYNLCGARLEGDAYEIPGFTRKQAKLGLLTAFNATTLEAATAALTDSREGKAVFAGRQEAARLLAELRARHAPIEKMLCSDAGMRLMNLDSRIMLTAVDRLIAKGIQCIPVHDSLVVPEQHESEAREALNFGWRTQNPQLSPCNIEKKRPKPLQYGCTVVGAPSPPPSGPSSCGWWSAVLGDARHDVVEWCS